MPPADETRNDTDGGCLGASRVVAFLDGELTPRERVLVEAHLASCDECRQLVSALAPDADPAAPAPAAPGPISLAPPSITPGQVIAGKYRVERVLGQGGMGVVVAAEHLALKQRVALKFLLSGPRVDRQLSVRFLREARVSARLASEHIARVLDYGLLPSGQAPYLVLEYLEGEDLGAQLDRQKRLPLPEALDLLLQAGEGLVVAHEAGVVHRDIKPGNFFVLRRKDGSPLVKLLDFGIAKAEGVDTMRRGASTGGAFLGSPRYASPEQFQSTATVDARSDIWSFGCVAYETLAGQPPFDSDTLTGLIAAVLTAEPPSLRRLDPAIPAAVDEVILRCLRKHPDLRPQRMLDVLAALAPHAPEDARASVRRRLRAEAPASAPPGSLASVPPGPPAVDPLALAITSAGLASAPGPGAPARPPLAPLAALALALALGAGWALWPRPAPQPDATSGGPGASEARGAPSPPAPPASAPSGSAPGASAPPASPPASAEPPPRAGRTSPARKPPEGPRTEKTRPAPPPGSGLDDRK
jgi:serine/threonine protein kinase